MLRLICPYCKAEADETELIPGGEAHLKRMGPGSTDQKFYYYLFERKNPRGVHFERWCHSLGCGKWFHAARCTRTMEVFGTYSAQETNPPQKILDIIKKKIPIRKIIE
tara:strand:- start:205 stop:528 length:324 start_codon:yes stop_codon:yes gene_type:complete